MADAVSFVFRFVHIFSGVMWVGGAFLWGMLIAPNILQRGPPAIRRPFLEAVLGKLTRYFQVSAILTILSGFVVLGLLTGWAEIPEAFQTGSYGLAMGIGVVAAVVMAIEGFAVIAPTGDKLLKLMQSMNGPPTAEQQAQLGALGKKIGIASMTTLLLGTIALGAMAWAVNVVRV